MEGKEAEFREVNMRQNIIYLFREAELGVLHVVNDRNIEGNKLAILKLHLWICVCVFQMNDKEKYILP